MSTSDKVKALLTLNGKKQSELAAHLGMSPQSLRNKMTRDNWSAKDLMSVADFVGCKIAFIMPTGQEIILDAENAEKEKPDV